MASTSTIPLDKGKQPEQHSPSSTESGLHGARLVEGAQPVEGARLDD